MKEWTEWKPARRHSALPDFIITPPLPLTPSSAAAPFFFLCPFFMLFFSCNRSPASPSPCQGGGFALRAGWPGLLWVRSEAGVAQEGGRPSTGTQHITRYFIVPFKKKPRLTVCGLTNWCCAYGDEVVFREAAGRDVVLQELLGKVLVHLSCLVGVHAVPTGLVQI